MAIIPSDIQKIYLQSNLRLTEKTTTRDKKPYPVQRPNNSIELANWLIETLTILGVYPPGGSGTISVLTNNNNGTYTHNDGTGNSVLIDIRPSNQIGNDLSLGTDNKLFFQETLTTLQLLGSTLRYTDEDSNITNIDLSQFSTLASNGLSFVAPNTIGLGGTLNQLNTSIDGNDNFLNIVNTSISRFMANTGIFIGADDSFAQLYLYTNKVFNSIATTGQVLAYDELTKIAEYEDLGSLPVINPTTSNTDTLQNTLDSLNTGGNTNAQLLKLGDFTWQDLNTGFSFSLNNTNILPANSVITKIYWKMVTPFVSTSGTQLSSLGFVNSLLESFAMYDLADVNMGNDNSGYTSGCWGGPLTISDSYNVVVDQFPSVSTDWTQGEMSIVVEYEIKDFNTLPF